MELNTLTALSPLDGRYRHKVEALAPYFSEFALIRYRLLVEIEYLIALHETGQKPLVSLKPEEQEALRSIYRDFDPELAETVKNIEKTTNHDVKAVEYYIKEKISAENRLREEVQATSEFVHFGLTSQDINNTAIPLSLKEAIHDQYLPRVERLIGRLEELADEWKDIPMLARTHGQPASPTALGKEFLVFAQRLRLQVRQLRDLPFPAKFGGATGNLNAHYVAYPEYDWDVFADNFVNQTLGLRRSRPTTQIEHYDGLAAIFDCLKRINSIVTDLCVDVWLYVSMEYFRQKTKKGEIGSSAMPHKVNPIDFENAEGNCGLSTALLEFMSRKLPVSRLQRDLTDSTVLRNLGAALGYAYLAQGSVLQGLDKLLVNESAIQNDLDRNWAVLAEAIQTILRREGFPRPYEALKDLTRGKNGVKEADLQAFVEKLEIGEEVKEELRALRPDRYLGNAGHQRS